MTYNVTSRSTSLSYSITLYIAGTNEPVKCKALSIKFEQTLLFPIQWPRLFKTVSCSMVVSKFPMKLLINNQFLVSVCCVYKTKKDCTWGVYESQTLLTEMFRLMGGRKTSMFTVAPRTEM